MRTDKLPERLREAIAARGLTRAEVATALGVDQSTVDHWIAGSRRPTAPTIERLGILLNVPPGDLLFGAEGRQ